MTSDKKGFAYQTNFATLCVEGRDALSFLNRMSTNDLGTGDRPMTTAFVTAQGRMVDYAVVIPKSPDRFLVVSSHPSGSVLKEWLEKYHFAEDLVIDVGPGGRDNLVPHLIFLPKNDDLASLAGFVASVIEEKEIPLTPYFSHPDAPCDIYISLIPPPKTHLTEDEFQTLRIACLLPLVPTEINDTLMPQNIGLDPIVSLNKGCYIGQEVLAKASLYQKNKRTLTALKLPQSDVSTLKPGAPSVLPDGTMVTLTSLAKTYRPDTPNALALIKQKA